MKFVISTRVYTKKLEGEFFLIMELECSLPKSPEEQIEVNENCVRHKYILKQQINNKKQHSQSAARWF